MVSVFVVADDGAVKQFVMAVEGDETIVPIDRKGVIQVAIVDVSAVKRGAKPDVEVPLFLPNQVDGTENQ
jgi:hypothetical protein